MFSRLSVDLTDKANVRSVYPIPVLHNLRNRVFGLKFSSAIPGGFIECSFSLLLSKVKAYEWYERILLYGIRISEGDEPIWEGRVKDIEIGDYGIDVNAEGYWANLADQTYFSFWSDSRMSNWIKPQPGAGGISNEISLAGVGDINKYIVEHNQGFFLFGFKKGITYNIGDKGILYYRLPRISNLSPNNIFKPMTIKAIQFRWDRSGADNDWRFKTWKASFPLGTWTEVDSFDPFAGASNLVRTIEYGASTLEELEAVAIGLERITGAVVPATDDGVVRVILTDVKIFATHDAVSKKNITASNIMTKYIKGDAAISLPTATRPKQIADDSSFIEPMVNEINPAIFEGQTIQDIVSKLAAFGMIKRNYFRNPNAEVSTAGWIAQGTGTLIVSALDSARLGARSALVGIADVADAGVEIQGVATHILVIAGQTKTFSVHAHVAAAVSKKMRLRMAWFNSSLVLQQTSTRSILLKSGPTFQRFSMTEIVPSGTVDRVRCFLEVDGVASGVFDLYADAAQLEDGELSPYFDGTFIHATWDGTAHLSESTAIIPIITGVFGRNRFHFKHREDTQIRWLISIRELSKGGLQLQRSVQDFWGKIWARYTDINGFTQFSSAAQATLEESIFFDQRERIYEAGETQGAVATKMAALALLNTRRPSQRSEITINGAITNVLGVREPLWRVRAGDVMMIYDLAPLPMPGALDVGIALDRLRTFVIKETTYNEESNELSIVPDRPPARLDLILAQLGTTPSLSTAGSISQGGSSAGGGSGGLIGGIDLGGGIGW